MIIKIKDGNEWWLYDDARRIHFAHKSLGTRQAETHSPFVVDIPDDVDIGFRPRGVRWTEDSGVYNYCVINFRMSDHDEFVIAFDDIAYILNDVGKTVETIRCPRDK